MPDFPDFTIPKWDRRDFAATKEVEWKNWRLLNASISSGATWTEEFYSIPSGKMLFITDFNLGADFKGYLQIYSVEYVWVATVYFNPYDPVTGALTVPTPVVGPEGMKFDIKNEGTETGRSHIIIKGWETTASKPEKPKSNDPLDLYKAGEFNNASIFPLSNGETLFLFQKMREHGNNYLRIKNIYRPNEKKLASFYMRPEETDEILNTIHFRPERIKEVLAKYEHKYKPKKSFYRK